MMMTPHKWPLCQALRRPQTLEVLNIIINCIAWLIVATPIHQCPSAPAASQLTKITNKNQHWRKVDESSNMKCEMSSRIRSPYPSFSCERYNICYIWRWQADKLNIRISRICQPCPVSPSPCIAQWIIRGQARLQYLNLNNFTNTYLQAILQGQKMGKILTNLKCAALFWIFDSGLAPEPLHYMDIVVHTLWRGAK